jgi:hypothetical protein
MTNMTPRLYAALQALDNNGAVDEHAAEVLAAFRETQPNPAKPKELKTPEQVHERFQRVYAKQLLDPENGADWPMIVDWANDVLRDGNDRAESVQDALDAYKAASDEDSEDRITRLHEVLLQVDGIECYSIDKSIVLDCALYGGGPAGGIVFEYSHDDHELQSAKIYHTEWFSQPIWYELSERETETMAEAMGMDAVMESL